MSQRLQSPVPAQEHQTDEESVASGGLLDGLPGLGALGNLLGNAGLLARLRGADPQGDGAAPRVDDAREDQLAPVAEAVAGARRMAATGLAVLAAGPGDPRHEALLQGHFHSTEAAELAVARARLGTAAAGLAGPVEIEVESHQPLQDLIPGRGETLGYVYRNLLVGEGLGAIHLCPAFFGLSAADQAGTLLHEATHRFAGTLDHAYAGTSAYRELDADDALENADSYATFCALEEAGRAADEALQGALGAEAAARDAAPAIWAAYQAGAIRLWQDGFTTPEGQALDPELVGRTINEFFRVQYPERCVEALGHVGEEVSWPDGMRVDAAFTRGMDPDPAEGWCS